MNIPELRTDPIEDAVFCAENPFYFLKHHFKTYDPFDPKIIAKPFPMDWPYLQDYIQTLWDVDRGLRKVIVDGTEMEAAGTVEHKTRQLLISTGAMGFYMWLWLYMPYPISVRVITETADKCYNGTKNSLLGKIEFAWDNLPPHLKQSVEFKGRPAIFTNPNNGAVILGSTTTDSAARGETDDWVHLDEVAFLGYQAQDLYTSVVPMARHLNLCSTPNGPNFWKWIVDQCKAHKLPYAFLELPCTVHPLRDAAYFEQKRRQLPAAKYAAEYLLSFELTQQGTCFDFSPEKVCAKIDLDAEYWNTHQLVYGGDPGLSDDTSFVFAGYDGKQLDLLADVTVNNKLPEAIYAQLVDCMVKRLHVSDKPDVAAKILGAAEGYFDPAGNQRNITNMETVYNAYVALGLKGLRLGQRIENKDALVQMARWIQGDNFRVSYSAEMIFQDLRVCHYPMDKHGRITSYDEYAHEGQGICNFNSHRVSACKYLMCNITAEIPGATPDEIIQTVYANIQGVGRRKKEKTCS